MRKKLDTRFPAARIKKIMQADEDVGKIAMAVPLLVSKALELFLQDLCDQTYEITLKRGAKTMNSHHLKQCVQTFNVFDFLRDIVKKVPDLGGSDAAGEDRFAIKRRKVVDDEDIENDEDSKRTKTYESTHSIGSGRGRGRGRGKGRGHGRQTIEEETAIHLEKFEDDPDMLLHRDKNDQSLVSSDDEAEPEELKQNISGGKTAGAPVRNFDLNVGLDENGDSATLSAAVNATSTTQASAALPTSSTTQAASEMKHEEYLGWSLDEMERMAIDPLQLANLNSKIDEEDYDEES